VIEHERNDELLDDHENRKVRVSADLIQDAFLVGVEKR
jgi:hypothetical protein